LAELATAPAWLDERRQRGASLAESLPLPDQKTKGWEFTDLSGLDLGAYAEASAEPVVSGAEGATVVSLAEALGSHGELLHERLGSLVPVEDPFVARNEAGWQDGVLVHPGYFFDFPREAYLVLSLLPPPDEFAPGAARIVERVKRSA